MRGTFAAGDTHHFREFLADPVKVEVFDHASTACGIGIHVQGHGLALAQRCIYALKGLFDLAPVPFARGFVMRNVQMHASIPSDLQTLVNGFQQTIPSLRMCVVYRASKGGHLRQLGDFLSIAESTGPIDQTTGKTEAPCSRAWVTCPCISLSWLSVGALLLSPITSDRTVLCPTNIMLLIAGRRAKAAA